MTINEAIRYYQKAQKENAAAQEAAKAADTKQHAAWNKVKDISKSLFDGSRKESPEYIAAMEASKAAQAAHAAANIAQAIYICTAHNVLEVARNTIYNEVTAAPDKYNKPMHYKVMKDRLNSICGENMYIYQSYSGIYLRMPYAPGESEIFLFDTNNDNTLNLDRPYLNNRAPELTLQEIKKEVKQAAKDAEKLRKAAEELYKKSEAMQAKYNSYVKHLMPYARKYNLEDNYRLF